MTLVFVEVGKNTNVAVNRGIMADLGNEYTLVELPAIEYLKDVLGYKDYIHGEKLIPALWRKRVYA